MSWTVCCCPAVYRDPTTPSLKVILTVQQKWCYKCQPFALCLFEFVALFSLGVWCKGFFFLSPVSSRTRNTPLVSCSSYLARVRTSAFSTLAMSDQQKLSQGPAVALFTSNVYIRGAPRSIAWQVWLKFSISGCALNCSWCFGYPTPHRGSASVCVMPHMGPGCPGSREWGCTWCRAGDSPRSHLVCGQHLPSCHHTAAPGSPLRRRAAS